MLRYCEKCDKSFDFDIRDARQLDELVCPDCGSKIDKNSRPRMKGTSEDTVYRRIGNTYVIFITIIYLFSLVLACIGTFGFFTHLDKLLFIMTGVSLLSIFISIVSKRVSGLWILLFVFGAVLGAIIVSNVSGIANIFRGACVGIELAIVLRYIIRDVFYRLIFALGAWGGKISMEENIATTKGVNQKKRQ